MTLGESIVSLRAQKGWSQGDLADMLDVSRQSVSKWETDSSVPELDKLLKLADLFGVTLDALVRGEEAPDKTAPETQQPTPQAAPADFSAQPLSTSSHRHTTAGVILLCTGAALFLLVLLLTGSAAGIIFAVPFLLCGAICLVSTGRRTPLWCAWALYLCADCYLRYATGLSWSTILLTPHWTPEMNYMRLIVAWGQFLAILAMIGATLFSYRRLALEVTKKRLAWLAFGWLAVLALMPYLLSLCQQLFVPSDGQVFRSFLYYLIFFPYSYLRLALIALLSVRTLAVFRAWRAEMRTRQDK